VKPVRFIKPITCFLLLVLIVGSALLTGCATADPDNLSVRPWNAPKGWENGLPSGMMEGR
jgi:hypothetical protein